MTSFSSLKELFPFFFFSFVGCISNGLFRAFGAFFASSSSRTCGFLQMIEWMRLLVNILQDWLWGVEIAHKLKDHEDDSNHNDADSRAKEEQLHAFVCRRAKHQAPEEHEPEPPTKVGHQESEVVFDKPGHPDLNDDQCNPE